MSDLSQIPDEILKQDIETWEKLSARAQTKEDEENARDVLNEIWEELCRRLVA